MYTVSESRGARVTMLGNLKGGTGKTTIAVNLACVLARGAGHLPPQRVLFIDLEPLATASEWLGVSAPSPDRSSARLFEPLPSGQGAEGYRTELRCVVQRAENEPVDVIPAHSKALEVTDDVRGMEFDLKDHLALLAPDYDHIVIDLPGSRTGRLVRSALVASHGVLVPVQPGSAAVSSTMDFFRIVEEIRRGANPALRVDGLVLSDAGSRNDADARVVASALAEALPYPVFETHIRTLKATQRASAYRVSVAGMGDREAMLDFTALAEEWVATGTPAAVRAVAAHG